MNIPITVVDTNILVSGLLRAASPPGQIIDAIWAGRLTPVLTTAVLAEYEAVLWRPRLRFKPAAVQALLDVMRDMCLLIDAPAVAPPRDLPDPSDWPFIACALTADCPVV